MTAPTVINIAQGDAEVGIQAGVVRYDISYQLPADPSPEQIFRLGARYLAARMPTEARRHIEEAVARGYTTDEAQFHRLLALLSGRTLRQLGSEDYDSLSAICGGIGRLGCDEWAAGLQTVLRLINSLKAGETDLVTKDLDETPPGQRSMIDDHLGVLMEGATQEEMWYRSIERARTGQLANDRRNRAWIFFQPEPAHPRVRPVRAASIPVDTWLSLVIGVPVLLLTAGNIGRLILQQPVRPSAVFAYLVAVAGVGVWVTYETERHFRRTRLQAKDAEFAPPWYQARQVPADGFTSKVNRYLGRYFGRYVPRNTDRASWLGQTAGIRARLEDELTEIYREQRIDADQIAWLIRHLVGDVRARWERGTLLAYRDELRTPLQVSLASAAGMIAAIAGALWVAFFAVQTAPADGATSVVLAAASAVISGRAWFQLASEVRRVRVDHAEHDQQQAARQEAFERWQRKLSRRPSDAEMAFWLECDRKLLIDAAMRQYRLKPRHVIAHAFIEAPGAPNKRARIERGPWRYTRYRLLLFLLTDDGVRQVNIDLDFEHCHSQITQRLNYRFDAVAAVQVDGVATQRQTFALTLVNGEPIRVAVTDWTTEAIRPHENPEVIFRVALDASGLPHTLNVLEGIAAEGKEWIRQQRRRADARLADLTTAITDLLD